MFVVDVTHSATPSHRNYGLFWSDEIMISSHDDTKSIVKFIDSFTVINKSSPLFRLLALR